MRQSLGKCRRSPAFVVSLLALFIALTGVGYAATGGSLILGRHNTASRGTALSSKAGPSLTLTNTGGKPAASFHVLSGKPPFAVNSNTKVRGLNADLLDGIDSSAFQRRVQLCTAAGSAIGVVNADGSVVCFSELSGTWNLTGNAGTDPSTDFLGTSDAQPLIFKTNNTEAMRIDTDGDLGVGTNTPGARVDAVSGQIAIEGSSTNARGVVGLSTNSVGVDGESATSGIGVTGKSSSGIGIQGTATSNDGVQGVSTSEDGVQGISKTQDGVAGASTSGFGVVGASTSGTAGVLGEGPHDGVLGMSSEPANSATGAAVYAINSAGGDLFIGQNITGNHVARIDSLGKGYFDGGEQTGGADYAESMQASVNPKALAPGDVLAVDPNHADEVRLSDSPDSQLVVGVYSTKPSVLATGNRGIDSSLAGTVPVAMLGIVPTKVSAENGAVKAGDLLTTARTPGYAMKAASVVVDGVRIYPTGAILGKALQALHGARGVIDVLVTLR